MFWVAVPAMIGLSLYPASSRVFLWLLINSLRSWFVMWIASPVVPRMTRPLTPPFTRKRECLDCVSRSSGGDTGSYEEVPSLAKKVGTGAYMPAGGGEDMIVVAMVTMDRSVRSIDRYVVEMRRYNHEGGSRSYQHKMW